MRGTDVFDLLNSLPADMITAAELPADELAAAGYGVPKKALRRERRALITSSPWFAAAVSVVVALGVLTLIVIAGRNGGAAGPQPVGSSPSVTVPDTPVVKPAETVYPDFPDEPMPVTESDWMECNDFAFKYKISEQDLVICPGSTFGIQCFVKNLGADFSYTGSGGDFCPHVTLTPSADTRVTYVMDCPLPDDVGTFKVRTGEIGSNVYTFKLPDDCPVGDYQLSMSYGNGSVGWSGCFRVLNAGTQTSGDFAFRYTSDQYVVELGGSVTFTVSLINNGPDISAVGASDAFQPQFRLRTVGGHLIECPVERLMDIREYTIPHRHLSERTYVVDIPPVLNPGACTLEMWFDPADIGLEGQDVCRVGFYKAFTLVPAGYTGDPDAWMWCMPGWDDQFMDPTGGHIYAVTSGDRWTDAVTLTATDMNLNPTERRLDAWVGEFRDYLTVIAADAFRYADRMDTLYIPKGVSVIERGAFAPTSLATIVYQGTTDDWRRVMQENPGWNDGCGAVTVRCADGDIAVTP